MNFASDNWAGADPAVAAALAGAATGIAPSYGVDDGTRAVEAAFNELFGREVAVFFVATGTAANALSLTALGKPGGIVFCHSDAHANTDEGAAPEHQSGLKLIGLPGDGAKLSAATLSAALDRYPPNPGRYGRPVAVSISQQTEFGTVYRPAEIAALAAVAHGKGLGVHMDGARFANAVAATGATPAELTWKAGVDVLSFGGTKGGCLMAEAVVFFDPAKAADFPYIRKRAGHLVSKSRFIAAQFAAWLDGGRWLALARHANAMAARLAAGITAAGHRLAWPAEGNEVFPFLPRPVAERLRAAGAKFYEWDPEGIAAREGEVLVRLVTSFATAEVEVERFLDLVRTV